LVPLKDQFKEYFADLVLNGKLVFYETGFIYVDLKLGSSVLAYDDILELNFYLDKEVWLEIKVKQVNSLTSNVLMQDKFFIRVGQKIFDEKYKYFSELVESTYTEWKVTKNYLTHPIIAES
jgi:hypothetical protein